MQSEAITDPQVMAKVERLHFESIDGKFGHGMTPVGDENQTAPIAKQQTGRLHMRVPGWIQGGTNSNECFYFCSAVSSHLNLVPLCFLRKEK